MIDGVAKLFLNMADQAISALQDNRNRDLDGIGYAILCGENL